MKEVQGNEYGCRSSKRNSDDIDCIECVEYVIIIAMIAQSLLPQNTDNKNVVPSRKSVNERQFFQQAGLVKD